MVVKDRISEVEKKELYEASEDMRKHTVEKGHCPISFGLYSSVGKQIQSKVAVLAFFLELEFSRRWRRRIIDGFGLWSRCVVKQEREEGPCARNYSMPYHFIFCCSITYYNLT